MAAASASPTHSKTTELDLHFAVWDNDLAQLAKLLEVGSGIPPRTRSRDRAAAVPRPRRAEPHA